MLTIRKSSDRGPSDLGWLKSKHTFSFGHYYDPDHMGYESLRVINDDRVAPAAGFGAHPHENMEIISYVLEGALEHKDSMGNGSVIKPGEVQRLSAGTGMTHSEFNHSKETEVHFLQIWFLPDQKNVKPSYEQKAFSDEEKRGRFRLVASQSARDGSVNLNQDVDMSVALLDKAESADYNIQPGRKAWVHIARGKVTLNGKRLQTGDGAAISGDQSLCFQHPDQAEIIVFDMAPITR